MGNRVLSIIAAALLVLGAAGYLWAQGSKNTESANASMPEPPPIPDPFLAEVFYDGQLCHWVRDIFQDSKDNLWFGTNHYGVMRYDGDTLEYFAEVDGLFGGRISGIVEDEDGNIWFAAYGGLARYDGQSFTSYPLADTDPIDKDVWCVVIDKTGLFWVGTSKGVFQFDGMTYTPFPIPKAYVRDTTSILAYDRVSCILEDSKGTMWFGTDGFGICRYDGTNFSHLTTGDGLCDNNVSSMMEDSKGNIWIGTMFGGVSRYDGEVFSNYTKDGQVEGVEIGGFFEDKSGNIWFAAEHHGVYRFDGQSFTNFYSDQGLASGGIISILEDREERFWFGGWKGLFRFDGKSFFPVLKDGPWQ